MTEERRNCWEFSKCGREHGGRRADERGVCPASTCGAFDGVNHGKTAGRFCWAVEGTQCQGSFDEKFPECVRCEFFKEVAQQEGESLILNPGEIEGGGTENDSGPR